MNADDAALWESGRVIRAIFPAIALFGAAALGVVALRGTVDDEPGCEAALVADADAAEPKFADVSPHQIRTASLRKEGDGHYWATARVNGAVVKFLVDTGATTDLADQARCAQDRRRHRQAGALVDVRTAAGRVKAGTVFIEKIEIDGVMLEERAGRRAGGRAGVLAARHELPQPAGRLGRDARGDHHPPVGEALLSCGADRLHRRRALRHRSSIGLTPRVRRALSPTGCAATVRAPGLAAEEAEHVARDGVQQAPCSSRLMIHGRKSRAASSAVRMRSRDAEDAAVDVEQQRGLVIGGAAEHHAIDARQFA